MAADKKQSLLSFIDDALHSVFSRREPDAAALRAKAIKQIDSATDQYGSVEPRRGRKAGWSANNDVVAFSPGYPVEGRETVYVPSNLFSKFLARLREEIEAGAYDKVLIEAAEKRESGKSETADAPVKLGKRGGPKGPRGPLSPEKLEARRAKVAARKAAEAA